MKSRVVLDSLEAIRWLDLERNGGLAAVARSLFRPTEHPPSFTFHASANDESNANHWKPIDTSRHYTMEDLEDELDLRYHRGLKPEVYYRCPTLEVRVSSN